jgi:hypothetical protein
VPSVSRDTVPAIPWSMLADAVFEKVPHGCRSQSLQATSIRGRAADRVNNLVIASLLFKLRSCGGGRHLPRLSVGGHS